MSFTLVNQSVASQQSCSTSRNSNHLVMTSYENKSKESNINQTQPFALQSVPKQIIENEKLHINF